MREQHTILGGKVPGKRNNFTTMCSLQSIPDCGPTRPGDLSFGDVTIVDDEDLGKTIPRD
jgi:hypothetical protein